MDPNLLPPGSDPNAPRVPAPVRFRSTNERGEYVESAKPLSNHRVAEPKYYYCTERVASMHRSDGKKIPFVNHICETDVKADIDHLDREIDDYENQYLRRATPEEIRAHLMRKDPRGSIKKELLADPTVRKEIEDSVRGSLEAQIRAQVRKEMGLKDEDLGEQEVDPNQEILPLVPPAAADAAKIGGTSLRERLAALSSAKSVTGGTLIMGGETPAGVLTHGGGQLKPVSSADIAGAAAGSGGGQE